MPREHYMFSDSIGILQYQIWRVEWFSERYHIQEHILLIGLVEKIKDSTIQGSKYSSSQKYLDKKPELK